MNNDDELYDGEEEILDIDDDSSSGEAIELPEEEYIDNITESIPQGKSPKQQNRQSLDNTINNIGSKSIQKTGIPKPLADTAIKKNGGTFSPANHPGGKLISNHFRNKVANSPGMNSLNSNKGDSNRLQQALHKNKFLNASKDNATNRENNQNVKEEVANKALQAGTSALAQSAGVPKPVADAIASKINVDKVKKRMMLKILVSCLPILIVILLPVLILAGDNNNKGSQSNTNEDKSYVNNYCSGITVTGENAGTYDLEDYVARVVSKENLWSENGNLENIKAQAVAARTYALRRTNNCTVSIENSTSAQVMASEAAEMATQGTSEVANQVLVDNNGDYISTEYDAFCYTSVDENNYTLCQQGVQIPTSWVNNHISQESLDYYQAHNHGRGMSQWGSRYLSTIGYKYDQILSTFYVGSTLKTLIPLSNGLQITSSGFAKRTSRALRDNIYFYNDNASNEGECAWYAVRRTNEILAIAGIDKRVSSGGNGADFCYSNDYKDFKHVYDINSLKPGMVISWSGGNGHSYGHVAVIEDVYYDSEGNVESVDISEGSNSSGTGYNTIYNGEKITNDYIWGLSEGSYKNQVRQYNCEGSLNGSNGTGCQTYTNVPASQLQIRWGSYHFVCGIDLLS